MAVEWSRERPIRFARSWARTFRVCSGPAGNVPVLGNLEDLTLRLHSKGFLPGAAGAEDDGYQDDGGAGLDENLAAVKPVDGGAF
jgi:hypothetical protein